MTRVAWEGQCQEIQATKLIRMRVDVSTWLKLKVASRRSLSRRGVEDHSTNLNDIAIKLTGVNSETPSLSVLYLKSREMPKQFLSVLSLYFPRNNENSIFLVSCREFEGIWSPNALPIYWFTSLPGNVKLLALCPLSFLINSKGAWEYPYEKSRVHRPQWSCLPFSSSVGKALVRTRMTTSIRFDLLKVQVFFRVFQKIDSPESFLLPFLPGRLTRSFLLKVFKPSSDRQKNNKNSNIW